MTVTQQVFSMLDSSDSLDALGKLYAQRKELDEAIQIVRDEIQIHDSINWGEI